MGSIKKKIWYDNENSNFLASFHSYNCWSNQSYYDVKREWSNTPLKLEQIPDFIRKLVRAARGQTVEDDPFFGLIKVDDPRERARLSEVDFYGHSCMKLLAERYEELEIWGKIAEMEDVYSRTIEGEQLKEAILMLRAKVEQTTPLTVQLPQVETRPPEQQPEQKKKGLLHRG